MKLITYTPDRTVTDIDYPADAGFTYDKRGRVRHKCGQFATFFKLTKQANGVLYDAHVYKCGRCDITIISGVPQYLQTKGENAG